jgi:hypothetical protein
MFPGMHVNVVNSYAPTSLLVAVNLSSKVDCMVQHNGMKRVETEGGHVQEHNFGKGLRQSSHAEKRVGEVL